MCRTDSDSLNIISSDYNKKPLTYSVEIHNSWKLSIYIEYFVGFWNSNFVTQSKATICYFDTFSSD